jgi:hypothetical protein
MPSARCTRAVKLRILVPLALATALVLVPTTASAKGPSEVEITGPGLEHPIHLERDSISPDQMSLLMDVGYSTFASYSAAPTERLGPRYVARITMLGPAGDETVRKELYPFADGGPLVHTRAGQELHGRKVASGWDRADDRLDSLLVSVGVPAVTGAELEWLPYHDYEHGLSISYPPSWQPAKSTVAPLLVDPKIPLALGTYDFPTEGCGAGPAPALRAMGPKDAFVAVYVYGGSATWGPNVTERPTRFGPDLPWSEGPFKCGEDVRGTVRSLNFPDEGRQLDALIAFGPKASKRRQNQIYRILDTLTVEPGLSD